MLINQNGKLFQIVLGKRRIAKKYLCGLFTFDFLANVPLAIALLMNLNIHHESFHYLKLLTLFRIVRLPALIRYGRRTLVRLDLDDKYLEILKLLLYWIVCIHWTACLHIIPGVVVAHFKGVVKVSFDNGEQKN